MINYEMRCTDIKHNTYKITGKDGKKVVFEETYNDFRTCLDRMEELADQCDCVVLMGKGKGKGKDKDFFFTEPYHRY